MALRNKVFALAAVLALGLSGTASALLITADVAGVPSCDLQGASCNVVATFDLSTLFFQPGRDLQLRRIGWDLTIDTIGASWLSEAVIRFSSTSDLLPGLPAIQLTAGGGDNFPGSQFYSSNGLLDLGAIFGGTPLLTDGILTIEFFESFDDVADTPDAFYVDPSFLYLVVSEPGILVLFGLGLLGVVVARRRSA